MQSNKGEKMKEKDVQAKKDILMELLAECDSELTGRTKKGLDGVRASKTVVAVVKPEEKTYQEDHEDLLSDIQEEAGAEPEMKLVEESEEDIAPMSKEELLEDMREDKPKEKMSMMDDEEEEGLFQKKRNKNS